MLQVSLKDAVTGAELPLKPGVNRIGRAEDNDVRVAAPSISGHHCEVTLGEGYIRIQDLGSTNGTYLDGARVQQATARPGQTLRLGDLSFYVASQGQDSAGAAPQAAVRVAPQAPATPAVAPVRPALTVSGSAPPPNGPVKLTPEQTASVLDVPLNEGDCPSHPGTAATLVCKRCGKKQCSACARANKVGMKTLMFCACGAQCHAIAEERAGAIAEIERGRQSTYLSALKYPYTRGGLFLLLGGTVLYLILDLLQMMPIRWVRWAAFVFGYGYLFGYMQQIVTATAHGEDDPPGWPELSDYGQDIVQPFFLLMGTVAVFVAPSLLAFFFGYPLLGLLLAPLAALLFPMALLAVLMSDSFSNLNPLFLVASIMKTPGSYLLACLVLAVLFGLSIGVEIMFNALTIPILPAVLTGFFSFYFITVYMRVLGLFYRRNRARLDWV